LAEYFRNNIKRYLFTLLFDDPFNKSNAITAVVTRRNNAGFMYETLKNNMIYGFVLIVEYTKIVYLGLGI